MDLFFSMVLADSKSFWEHFSNCSLKEVDIWYISFSFFWFKVLFCFCKLLLISFIFSNFDKIFSACDIKLWKCFELRMFSSVISFFPDMSSKFSCNSLILFLRASFSFDNSSMASFSFVKFCPLFLLLLSFFDSTFLLSLFSFFVFSFGFLLFEESFDSLLFPS